LALALNGTGASRSKLGRAFYPSLPRCQMPIRFRAPTPPVVVPILAGIWTALPPGVSSSHFVPQSWVFAFLAALAVTVGQVLYQLRGPQIVRRSTLEDYVRDARREYRDQPTPEKLDAADEVLGPDGSEMSEARRKLFYPQSGRIAEFEETVVKTITNQDQVDPDWVKKAYDYDANDALVVTKDGIWQHYGQYVAREGYRGLRNGRVYSTQPPVSDFPRNRLSEASHALNSAGEAKRRALPAEGLRALDERRQTDRFLHETTKIGYAARKQYLIEANRRRAAMLIATGLYVIAIALIVVITVDQTLAVLQAAGWWRPQP
jgi:hypothetical protein